jgi:hypothetical protein
MPIIVIDAGHGGRQDAGRSTWQGTDPTEKEVTLELARRVAQEIGAEARLTRANDVNLTLAERCAVARRLGASAFVSIHAHEGKDPPETYVHQRASASSHALARSLAARVRVAEMAVLTPERLAPGTAACLLEIPSLSRDPQRLAATSRAIAAGIRRHLGGGAALESAGAPSPGGRPFARAADVSPLVAGHIRELGDQAQSLQRALNDKVTTPLEMTVTVVGIYAAPPDTFAQWEKWRSEMMKLGDDALEVTTALDTEAEKLDPSRPDEKSLIDAAKQSAAISRDVFRDATATLLPATTNVTVIERDNEVTVTVKRQDLPMQELETYLHAISDAYTATWKKDP